MTLKYPYTRQSINDKDKRSVAEAVTADMVTRGDQTAMFEKEITDYVGSEFAVAFNSGTSALWATYFACETGPSDTVVTSPNTFVGTVAGALHLGAKVSYLDIDPLSGNMVLPEKIMPVASRGKQIITPVHYAGNPVDMKGLQEVIGDPTAVVIEDACHALGGHYPCGARVGSCKYADMTVFSFHPAKTITTGEGGVVTTNNENLYSRLLLFRNNGIVRHGDTYDVVATTGNFHMSDLQAALGRSQLTRIDEMVAKRRKLSSCYSIAHTTHAEGSAHHLFVALIDFDKIKKSREQVREELANLGIGSQVHYIPLYNHTVLKQPLKLEGVETFYKTALSLPLYVDLKQTEAKKISKAVEGVLS